MEIDTRTVEIIRNAVKVAFIEANNPINISQKRAYQKGLKDMHAFLYRDILGRIDALLDGTPKDDCECEKCFHNCTTFCDFQHYCKKMFNEPDMVTDIRLTSPHPQKRWTKTTCTAYNDLKAVDEYCLYRCPVCGYSHRNVWLEYCPKCDTPLYYSDTEV